MFGWPTGLKSATFARQADVQKMLIGLAAEIFAATCYVEDMRKTIEHLFGNEAVLDRISMVVIVGNAYSRKGYRSSVIGRRWRYRSSLLSRQVP